MAIDINPSVKILITGDKGFIGAHTLTYFHNKGYDIIGTSEDIRNIVPLRSLFTNIDYVIHTAGKVKKGIPNEEDYHTTNVLGTENILKLCLENGCKLIHLSSVAAEGAYGISKQKSQELVETYNKRYGLKVVTLRLCVIYSRENDTKRSGPRYPIYNLIEDFEDIINNHNFTEYLLKDYSNTRVLL